MKKIEKFASALVGIGIFGAIFCASTAETDLTAFIICEAVCFALAITGAVISNRTAETEAPAVNTMKRGESRNS